MSPQRRGDPDSNVTRITKAERPPTIRDVAREAGVSLPTVSRVLTGAVPVSEKRRNQVLDAMTRLGYRPNGAARALVHGRQPIIGVVAPDVSFGSSAMIRAVEREARRSGYVVTVTVVNPYDLTQMGSSLDVLLAQPIVGVVVLDFDRFDLEELTSKLGGVPVSAITSATEEATNRVVVDDRAAARAMTEHLLSLGHRTVHHVSFPGPRGRMHPREQGWRDALVAHAASIPDPIQIDTSVEDDLHVQAGQDAVPALLRNSDVTAVFCANDQIAFGVIRTLTRLGISVPEAVSVVGIDNEPIAKFWSPSLTTYNLDFEWAGALASQMLLQGEGAQDAGEEAGPPSIGVILRESSASPPNQS